MITLSFSKSILEKLQDNLLIALRLSNIRLYRLTQALLWFSEETGIKEIAKRLGVDIKTIVNWLKTFMKKRHGMVNKSALSRPWSQRKAV